MLDGAKLIQGDVKYLTDLLDTIKKYNVEYIVHFAAIHIGEFVFAGSPVLDRSAATSPFE
jgi:hypothetical protein